MLALLLPLLLPPLSAQDAEPARVQSFDARRVALAQRASGNQLIDLFNPDAEFRVFVSTRDGATTLTEDERLQLVFEATRSCYLTVLTRDPEGEVLLLVPNANTRRDFGSDHVRLAAGQRLTVPPDEPGRARGFPILPPHGECLVKVIATERPLDIEALRALENETYTGLGALDGQRMKSIDSAVGRLKAIGQEAPIGDDPAAPEPVLSPPAFATAELYVVTGKDPADLVERRERRDEDVGLPPPPPPIDDWRPEPPPLPPRRDDPRPISPPIPELPELPELPDLPDLPPLPPIDGTPPAPPPVDWGGSGERDPNDAIVDRWEDMTGRTAFRPFNARRATAKALAQGTTISELLVFYEEGQAPSATKSLERNALLPGMRIVKVRPDGTKSLSGGEEVDQRIRELREQPGVRAVVPNFWVRPASRLEPPLLALQWGLENRFRPGVDIGWASVAELTQRIATPLIGVCDQGLNIDDPRLAPMVWTNPRERASNNRDDDGNGLVDDVHGYNFLLDNHCIFDSAQPFNHGSFCSSIIAGRPLGRADDVIGIAPRATILPAAVLGPEGGPFNCILAGIAYCAQNGAKVINLSLGNVTSEADIAEINRIPLWDMLEADGIVLVCSAGNDALDVDLTPTWPSCMPRSNVVSVLATDAAGRMGRLHDPYSPRETRAWKEFSNYGAKNVHIGAPGSIILGIPTRDQVDLCAGTSFSAPMVTAAVALVMGQHPEWDHRTVIRAILETARPSPHLRGKCRTGGVLDLRAALAWRP